MKKLLYCDIINLLLKELKRSIQHMINARFRIFSTSGVVIYVHKDYNTITNQKAFVLNVDIIKKKLNEEKRNTKNRQKRVQAPRGYWH